MSTVNVQSEDQESIRVVVQNDATGDSISVRVGDQGAGLPGPAGPIGPGGPAGVSGEPGLDGAAGPAGPPGADGPAGIDGLPGVDGADGAPGVDGQPGPAGADGAPGPIGPEGPVGLPGIDGADGADGTGVTILGTLANESELPATGNDGDAYLINGDLFVWDGAGWINVGTIQGPAGPGGPAGATGPQGETIQGPAGADGLDGTTGPTGADGAPGPQGDTGPTGAAGPQGIQGETGATGATGATGSAGADGNVGPVASFPEQIVLPTPAADVEKAFAVDVNGITSLRLISPTGLVTDVQRDDTVIARNETGSVIPKGTPVYISGVSASSHGLPATRLPLVAPARANSATTMPVIGVTLQAIANNGAGRVMSQGMVIDIDTSAFVAGQRLWVSSAVAGALTGTRPAAPVFEQRVAVVVRAHATNGQLLVGVRTMLEKGLADGVASLDGTGKVPSAQLPAGSATSVPVDDEGTQVVAAPTRLNFTGAGVTATNVAGVARIDIPGGGGGGASFPTTPLSVVTGDDLLWVKDDPAGTPADRSVTAAVLREFVTRYVNPVAAFVAGNYYDGSIVIASANGSFAGSIIYAGTFVVDRNITVDQIGIMVSGASAAGVTGIIGIQTSNASLLPNTVLHESAPLPLDTTGFKSSTFDSVPLSPGIYFLSAVFSATTGNIRSRAGGSGLSAGFFTNSGSDISQTLNVRKTDGSPTTLVPFGGSQNGSSQTVPSIRVRIASVAP